MENTLYFGIKIITNRN